MGTIWQSLSLAALCFSSLGEPGCRSHKPQPSESLVPRTCELTHPLSLAECVDKERYVADLRLIANERPPESPHWEMVQDLCEKRLRDLGYAVEKQDYGSGVNVIGVRQGTAPSTQVIVSAHYDHIHGCPGADDNATGLSAALETARVLSMTSFKNTLVIACWDEEERGLFGSEAYARRAKDKGQSIRVAYVYETVGYVSKEPGSQKIPPGFSSLFPSQVQGMKERGNRGDFLACVADADSSDIASELVSVADDRFGLKAVSLPVSSLIKHSPLIADLRRSDHASFWKHGFPAIMLTDTADYRNPNYHCQSGRDTVDTLDFDFTTKTIKAVVASAAALLNQ